MNKTHLKGILTLLLVELRDGVHYTLEELSEKLGHTRANIHRAFMQLGRRVGWSIRPSNELPYGRSHGLPRGRRGVHDVAEPDWSRTLYLVRRPKDDGV